MIFTSQIFLFWFLPAVLALYAVTPRPLRSLVLTLASYVFYGWWRPDFVLLMLFSTVVDYACGAAIHRGGEALAAAAAGSAEARAAERRRKRALCISVCVNLGLLGYFKYWNFGVDSLDALLTSLGFAGVTWPAIVLPVGISFYTFQTMSYSIDVYRGEAPPVRNLTDFACYVALFPQLVAGPIVRYKSLAAQLAYRTVTVDKLSRGATLFQVGFIKKVLLADTVAAVADRAFELGDPTALEAWLGATAYAFQIYFDFSGYSDMAIGLGLLFGFEFPINFDSPYKSQSVTEFWRRWHISLSSWLRDYLYIPLGGNRKGTARTYVNLSLTMLLGGLWHGAAWTFVAWGAWQGLWLVVERLIGKQSPWTFLPRPGRVLATFVVTLGGWVFFRATSFEQAWSFLGAMAGLGRDAPLGVGMTNPEALALVVCAALVFLAPNSQRIVHERRPYGWLVWLLIAGLFPLAVCHLMFQSYSPFLYFQF